LSGTTITWSGLTVTTTTPVVLTFDAVVEAPTGDEGEYLEASEQDDPNSTPGNDSTTEDDDDTASVTPQSADLSLSKTVDDPTPNVGDTVTFTIQVSNAGPDEATFVSIEDVVPAGYSGITNISGTGSLSGTTITWSGLTVPVGDNTVTLTFDADVEAPTGDEGEYLNVVDQADPNSTPNNDDGDQSEDDEDNASVTPQEADLSLVKTVSDETPNVGDTVTFTIQVSNDGPDAATGVSIQDVVPAGYSTITNISDSGTESGGTITWSGLTVPVGDNTVTLTFDADVEAPTGDEGEYLNVVTRTMPRSRRPAMSSCSS
jgi:uncharacterized repeat protein (TIGR01451 family)